MSFEFHAPSSVSGALQLLEELGRGAQVLAGGTDVMVQYQRHEISPAHLVCILNLRELAGIQTQDGVVTIGALTTHRELATSELIRREFTGLAEAANTVGGWQTQNIATLGGNLCNASPAADTPPPLLVADAAVRLRSRRGERTVPLGDFFLGRRETARRPEELLVDITIQRPPPSTGEVYLKLGRRHAMEIAVVGLAMRLTFDDALREVREARLALCSVAPRPFRATEAEQALVGSRLEPEALERAGALAAGRTSPIDDVRASGEYRRWMVAALVRRAAELCRQRALSATG